MTNGLGPLTFTQPGDVSSPRACAKIAGKLYPVSSYRLSKNSHGATNTGSMALAIAGNPDWTRELTSVIKTGQTDPSPIYLELWAGFPPAPSSVPSLAGLQRRFYGVLDTYEPDNLSTTEFRLRSIAAPLTTDAITTAVQNVTTVDFIRKICASYNIKVSIDPTLTNPFTLARVYAQDFVVGLKNLKKWDIFLRSSIADDCDLWEDDGTVYYYHPWNVQRQTVKLVYGTSIKDFHPSHSPQFSRTIRVQVHSYSQKIRTATTVRVQSVVGGIEVSRNTKTLTSQPNWGTNSGQTTTYLNDGSIKYGSWSSSGGSTGSSNVAIAESGIELYNFYLPNLSYDECNKLTTAIWRQISMHEYQGTIEYQMTPALLKLTAMASLLDVSGYPMSKFNTQYWPRTMEEVFEGAQTDENSGEAPGWYVTYHGVNHTLPLGGGV